MAIPGEIDLFLEKDRDRLDSTIAEKSGNSSILSRPNRKSFRPVIQTPTNSTSEA
jgi:hypothetical protein